MKILVATHPFGETGRKPFDLLTDTGWGVVLNPLKRRLKAGEVRELLTGFDAVIAGTEPYTPESLAGADNLKVIARVGIGLDNVDLDYCEKRRIQVTYTPEAPSDAVAELTVANILNLARRIGESDKSVREKAWNRLMGSLLRELKIGVVGVGRIGSRVIRLLEPFKARVLAVDTNAAVHGMPLPGVSWVSLDTLLKESDIVTLHIPLNKANTGLMSRDRIATMKTGACLINTSRGGVLDELALTDALLQRHLGGAALDVFNQEPYEGRMCDMDNVILTAHIGASTRASRYLMELTAAEDCVRVLKGLPPAFDAFKDPSR